MFNRFCCSLLTRKLPGLLAALSLTACTTVGPDYEAPDTKLPDSFVDEDQTEITSESRDLAEWWKVFNDPVLDELIAQSHAENLPLQIAGIRILEARARLGVAVGNLYPQQQTLGGSVTKTSASDNRANTAPLDLRYNDYSVGLDATWELDIWGKFRRGIESSEATFLASIASYDDVLVTLTAEVANAYVLIRTFEERLKLARQNEAIQQRSYEIADVRFQGGVTTELDVQQAITLLRTTQAFIPDLETGLRQSKNGLAVLLGRAPGDVDALLGPPERFAVIPTAPPEVAVGIPADLLRRRPDIRQAELQAMSQAANIGVAKADLYPSFALFGTVGLVSSGSTDTTKSGESGSSELFSSDAVEFFGGTGFSWNVLNYGRIKNQVRAQDARYQGLLSQLPAVGSASSAGRRKLRGGIHPVAGPFRETGTGRHLCRTLKWICP